MWYSGVNWVTTAIGKVNKPVKQATANSPFQFCAFDFQKFKNKIKK
tara:strand:- start:109 stop:246 length:138 start_codon:yes stop_codon:yes gene_type:complete